MPKVWHGEIVQPNEPGYLSTVALGYVWDTPEEDWEDRRMRYMCSGVVISPIHVITARHCFPPRSSGYEQYGILLGKNPAISPSNAPVSLRFENSQEYAMFARVSYFSEEDASPHPLLDHENDLMIVTLDRALEKSQPVPIWLGELIEDQTFQVFGFGRAETRVFGPPLSPERRLGTLRSGAVKIKRPHFGVRRQYFLAKGIPNDAGPGDSGGPVLKIGDTTSLVGIVVGGGDCEEGKTGVYLHVAYYREWIESVISHPRGQQRAADP